jgi:hypothetical protein
VIFVGFNPIVDTSVPVEQTVTYKDTGGATLKIAAKTWFNAAQLQSEQDTFGPVTSRTTYTYGSGDQLTERDDYDFGPGSPGGLLRKTVTAYQAFAATPTFPSSPSILDRPSSTIVYAGTSRVAESDYLYDTVGVGSVTATGHDDAAYGTSFNVRGNLTKNIQKCIQPRLRPNRTGSEHDGSLRECHVQ